MALIVDVSMVIGIGMEEVLCIGEHWLNFNSYVEFRYLFGGGKNNATRVISMIQKRKFSMLIRLPILGLITNFDNVFRRGIRSRVRFHYRTCDNSVNWRRYWYLKFKLTLLALFLSAPRPNDTFTHYRLLIRSGNKIKTEGTWIKSGWQFKTKWVDIEGNELDHLLLLWVI